MKPHPTTTDTASSAPLPADDASRVPRWQVAAVAVGALLVCLLWSWHPSIWNDEGVTISASTRSLAEIWQLTGRIDAVHAVYYALMSPWFALVGVNEVTLRLPSAIMVALTSWAVVRLAERWATAGAAVAAGVLFAVLPRTTWMGIEGRSWALAALLAVLATLLLVRWLERGGWAGLAGYAVVLGLGIQVEVYLVFLAVAHVVTLLMLHRRRLLPALGAMVVAALIASPIIVRASGQTGQIETAPLSLSTWARQLVVNQNFTGAPIGSASWLDQWWRPTAGAAALLGWALVVLLIWSARRAGQERRRAVLAWCLPWLLLPSVLVAVWSLLGQNMYNPRYFSFCVPAMAILLAMGFGAIVGGWWRTVLAIVLVVLLVPGYLGQRTLHAKSGADWSVVATYVDDHAGAGDGVFFAPKPAARLIAIAYPQPFTDLVDVTLLEAAGPTATLAGTDRPLTQALGTAPDRVWAIWRSDDPDLPADVAAFIRAGYVRHSQWSSTMSTVIEFTRA